MTVREKKSQLRAIGESNDDDQCCAQLCQIGLRAPRAMMNRTETIQLKEFSFFCSFSRKLFRRRRRWPSSDKELRTDHHHISIQIWRQIFRFFFSIPALSESDHIPDFDSEDWIFYVWFILGKLLNSFRPDCPMEDLTFSDHVFFLRSLNQTGQPVNVVINCWKLFYSFPMRLRRLLRSSCPDPPAFLRHGRKYWPGRRSLFLCHATKGWPRRMCTNAWMLYSL